MSIIKVSKIAIPFAQIPNATLRDRRLPLDALGLLTRLLSRPAGWEVRVKKLQSECGVGRDKIQRVMRDLEGAGYLSRRRIRRPGGTFAWVAVVRDVSSEARCSTITPERGVTVGKMRSQRYGDLETKATTTVLTVDGEGGPLETKSEINKESSSSLPPSEALAAPVAPAGLLPGTPTPPVGGVLVKKREDPPKMGEREKELAPLAWREEWGWLIERLATRLVALPATPILCADRYIGGVCKAEGVPPPPARVVTAIMAQAQVQVKTAKVSAAAVGKMSKAYISAHARPGESWDEARVRLRGTHEG